TFVFCVYPLELVEAELLDEECWIEALRGVTYVYHVASPVLVFEKEETLVRQAVQGTLNVLKASVAAGTVKRFVFTSSLSAVVVSDHLNDPTYTYTESDWSVEGMCDGYEKSKLLAERAALDFMSKLDDDKKFELSVINPGAAMGPVLTNVCSSTAILIDQLLSGKMPVLAEVSFPMIDVRDVAAAHIRAMELDGAAGQRYVVSGEPLWMTEIADIIRAEFEPQGYSIASRVLPKGIVWAMKFVSAKMKYLYRQIGLTLRTDCSKAKNELGIDVTARDINQCIIEGCYSLIERGLVDRKPGYKGAALSSLNQPIEEPGKVTSKEEKEKREEEEEKGNESKEGEKGAVELTVPQGQENQSEGTTDKKVVEAVVSIEADANINESSGQQLNQIKSDEDITEQQSPVTAEETNDKVAAGEKHQKQEEGAGQEEANEEDNEATNDLNIVKEEIEAKGEVTADEKHSEEQEETKEEGNEPTNDLNIVKEDINEEANVTTTEAQKEGEDN
ncbi:PREDICTED: uncharacterized protein LOC100636225, partial [Amphimedon queenslandica]|uniref:NAD-dependent epimerase/dehydratase domain-containing protein n=2 Tax=Amphimedon queenslandica TaxID=400682 RepID=A0AAN0IJI0_AMPQE